MQLAIHAISLIQLLFILQYSRNMSQTRWIIDDERMGELSVEVLSTFLIMVIIILIEVVSMKQWVKNCQYNVLTLQEIIGSNVQPPVCQGDNYKFHAARREDLDVLKICFPCRKFGPNDEILNYGTYFFKLNCWVQVGLSWLRYKMHAEYHLRHL